jgi:hypothetical protein
VKRDDCRANLPPWAIFRVSKSKFEEYRIAWQEISKDIEAAYLPVFTDIDICSNGIKKRKLFIPIQTVYFIVEKNLLKALKLLLYLNSDLARSLVKLWAWSLWGGPYRHTSYTMGILSIPKKLVNDTIWDFLKDYLKQSQGFLDLNIIASSLSKEAMKKLEDELIQAFEISRDEYEKIVEYGKWLNETTLSQVKVEEGIEEESSEEE